MDRRAFICTLAGGLLAAPPAAEGQPTGKLPRVGILLPGSTTSAVAHPTVAAFEVGLRDRGWVEGGNISIERRYAEGRPERYPDLAVELVRLKVDVIVAGGGPASLKAARDATKTIPIVMVASSRDPIGDGLIKSFAQPGGNITGLTTAPADLGGKQLELLKEAVRVLSRVGVLWDATVAPYSVSKEIAAAARSLGVELLAFVVREPTGIEPAITDATKAHIGGLTVNATPMFGAHRSEIADLLTKHRLPAIGTFRSQAEAGLLMTYGPSITNEFHSAAAYVDKILKGANPGDLPVEQPTKYELIINMKTAKVLGLSIPQSLLLRADEVIQ